MSWWSRVADVFRSDRLDQDLEDEQRFHIEERAEELEARGLSREGALAQARRQFGRRIQIRESSRDVRLMPWLDSLWRDVRFGQRLLRKDAVVSLAAIVSLGLAIGACTAAFSLVDALILRKLPVPDPGTLVYVDRAGKSGGPSTPTLSYPLFERIRQGAAPQMEAFSMSQQSLRQAVLADAAGIEEKLRTQYVSGNAFTALGVTAVLGRVLLPSDDVTVGAHQVAVISHAFWQRRLGGSPGAIGQWIQLEQKPFQIVGVAEAGFTGAQPGVLTDIWVPNMMFHGESIANPNWGWLQIWGRLGPGVTADTIQPIVRTAVLNLEGEGGSGKGRAQRAAELAVELVPGATGISQIRNMFARPLLALAAIIGVVLLIACSNVANLLLARGAARTREMSLRASIGAGRGRLLQQILVESGVLTLAATVLGLLCAKGMLPFMVRMLSTNENPVYLDTRLDWRVLAFVAALGGLTTVLFGLVPAIRASSASPGTAAAAGDRNRTAHPGMANSLVAAQIAFSLMILFVAALLLRSFDRLLQIDLGFTPERVALISVEARDKFEPDQARELIRQLRERVAAMPGVESASISGWALFRGWSWGNNFELPGGGRAQMHRLAVSAHFFKTMGTAVLDGRELQPSDNDGMNPMPVVVNEAFARKYFPAERAVGRRMTTTSRGQQQSFDIVGVVANVRDGSVRGDVPPYVFSPTGDPGGTLQIRSSADLTTIAAAVRQELPRVHPSLRLTDVTTQSALVGNTLLRERLLAVLSGFFAALGLVLAAVGLYGMLSYAVVRRTREIGIRLTLGAQPPAVVRAVIGRVAIAIGLGVVAGLAGGAYFATFVRTLLYEVEPFAAASFVVPVLGLLAVGIFAAWFPARRATRVDPAEALRME
jgi:predicted permease